MSRFLRSLLLAGCTALSASAAHADAVPAPPPGEPCDYATFAGASTIVTEWNQTVLGAICRDRPWPTVASRALFLTHAAIYDAWASQTPRMGTYGAVERVAPMRLAALREAISHAAHGVLTYAFPDQIDAFDARLREFGYEPGADSDAARRGAAVARAILDRRGTDGARAASAYAPTVPHQVGNGPDAPLHAINPNRWQPLIVPTGLLADPSEASGLPLVDPENGESYVVQSFVTPHWGSVEPFALPEGDALRPPAPPVHGSDAPYTDARGRQTTSHEAWLEQTRGVAEAQAELTDRTKVVAEYWADGPRSATPPGHWNLFAQMVSLRDGHGIERDARMFLALNGAMMDAAIATWDAKATYDFIRPVTAIHFLYRGQTIDGWRGPDRGIGPIEGTEWRPYQDPTFVTPAFAEYPSGHSAFSAAGAEVLRRFTGSDAFHDPTTLIGDLDGDGRLEAMGTHRVVPGDGLFEGTVPSDPITLRWKTFSEAATEAGLSRIYGGIHFQDGDLRGRELGRAVGGLAFERAAAMWDGAPVETP